MPRFTDIGSYVTGLPTRDDRGVLVLSIDELAERKVPHCVIIVWEAGKFLSTTQKGWLLADVVPLSAQDERLLCIGTHGKYLEKNASAERDETMVGPGISIDDRGPLRCAKNIAGHVYVVGGDRQAYRMTPERRWQSLDQGQLSLPSDDGKIFGFEALDGFDPGEIYAVGLRGEIWLYNDRIWQNINSPTNILLTTVCCAGDGYVYIAGMNGLLLKGRNDTWEVIDLDGFAYDFWDLCWFQEKLYLATMHTIYRLDGDAVTAVDSGACSCAKLSCTAAVMWSIGAKDVMAFDGLVWSRID